MAKKASQEKDSGSVVWTVNVKYRGKRYKAREVSEIQEEDREGLIADGVIRKEEE
ncbi:hypothetical protein [Brevibacillus laterosporus]|uniref:DUF7210 family protein n=1 Tax=Brevibacillus laterosporus TaxID=1465 RepID=UPI0003B1DD93|nr:hypothetical protein [Brevibacillus laterosporus]ERM20336.1 hypothetical protein P615_00060 [Brevibacillus laterosporus PE36]